MYNLEDVTKLPEDFNGQVRLFPLPNLVGSGVSRHLISIRALHLLRRLAPFGRTVFAPFSEHPHQKSPLHHKPLLHLKLMREEVGFLLSCRMQTRVV